jgi:hypothetical protein
MPSPYSVVACRIGKPDLPLPGQARKLDPQPCDTLRDGDQKLANYKAGSVPTARPTVLRCDKFRIAQEMDRFCCWNPRVSDPDALPAFNPSDVPSN